MNTDADQLFALLEDKSLADLHGDELRNKLQAELTDAEKLHELYAVMWRIAFTHDKVGYRPLAGGVEVFAKRLLIRHGFADNAEVKPAVCASCGRPLDNGHEHEPVPEKVAGYQREAWRMGI